MPGTRSIFIFSIVASAIFLAVRPLTGADWPVIFKTLSILLLAVAGFRRYALLGAALTASAAGDFLLGVSRLGGLGPDTLFLLGLGAFLIAHLLYIALFRAFLSARIPSPRAARLTGILAILLLLVALLSRIYGALGGLRGPVILYAAVISTMGVCAMLAKIPSPLAAVGALLFIASDSLIALGKFSSAIPAGGILIWVTYYAAQLSLARAFENARTVK
ncbi:MAG TPA: lysoplasmalogenase [Bryobacteraceae bacterium]|jgi:uncharacterized membrane protein YhhN|nr:lysoplasmalogenase [Bryobacteraceae bacterium]